MLTALALTYVYSEKYESYTAISYRVQEVTRFKAQQNEAMGSPAPQAPFKVIGSTLQEVLKSDVILYEVVKELELDKKRDEAPEGPWYRVWYHKSKEWIREQGGNAWKLMKYGRLVEEDPVASAVEELRANIRVTNRDSYIFHLQVRDRYPDRAARIADRMTQVLNGWLLELDRRPGRNRLEQLGLLLEQKQRDMDAKRREIQSLMDGSRVASVQLETERLTENLAALQLEESRLLGEIARVRERLVSVQGKLDVKQRLLEGRPAGTQGEYVAPDDYRKLASQQVFEDVELKSLLAKHASLQQSIEAVSARLRKLPGLQARLDAMKVDIANTEREFTLLKDSYQEAAVRSTSPVSEVRVLHPALVPTSPVSPIKVYHVLLAGGLGLLVSVGLVYLLEFLGLRGLLAPPPAPVETPPPLLVVEEGADGPEPDPTAHG